MNAFGKWIKRSGMRPVDVARAMGLPQSSINRFVADGYWPPLRRVALRIKRVTGGEVTVDDLLDDRTPPENSPEYRLARMIAAERASKKENQNGKASLKRGENGRERVPGGKAPPGTPAQKR